MLARPHLAHKAFTATLCRYYSEAALIPPSYHPKVRAIPFAFSPEDAASHIGIAASMAGYVGRSNKGHPNVPFASVLTSILAKYFPTSGFKPLQPTRILPVYFPTWFVSAELEAMAWLSSESDTEGSQSETATVQFEDLYLPGFNMDFGRVLVRDPPRHIELAEPFSPDLAHQWGLDVLCLSYNVLPFGILDRTRSLSYIDAVISENLRFNPQSVKTRLAAAYPVLLPVYLAQYVSKEPWPPITMILAAHSDPGVHYIHIPHLDAEDSVRLPFEELVAGQDDYIDVEGSAEDTEAELQAIVVNPKGLNVSDELSSWLSDKLQQRNVFASMAARHPIDMEDPRIREWTQEEVDPVYSWLRMDRARAFVKPMFLKTMNMDKDKGPVSSENSGAPEWSEELADPIYSWLRMDRARSSVTGKPIPKTKFVAALLDTFHKADSEWRELRDTLVPEWWRRWEESQKPRRSSR